MPILEQIARLPFPKEEVFDFHRRPDNLVEISPSFPKVELEEKGCLIQQGTRLNFRVSVLFITLRWVSQIQNFRENKFFVDVQIKGPFRTWWHIHEFRSVNHETELREKIYYELKWNKLGLILDAFFVRWFLRTWLRYRNQKMEACLANQRPEARFRSAK